MKTWADFEIDESLLVNPQENKIPCPRCGPKARRAGKRDLSVNKEKGTFQCWNDGTGCGFKGSLSLGVREPEDTQGFGGPGGESVAFQSKQPQQYRRISKEWYLSKTDPLPQEAIDWLTKRGISEDTWRSCGLRWGTITKERDGSWVKGIFFPYLKRDTDGALYIANIKKRCLCCKDHMQSIGHEQGTGLPAELVFYGLPNIDTTTIVVEGEMDALAYYTAGIKNVISVPNGATLKSDTARLGYMEACKAELARARHVILSVDDDQPGRLLKNELARRIGYAKCSYVVYPEGCKDANDVLLKYGPERLWEMATKTIPFPSEGIVRPEDMLAILAEWKHDGMPSGFSTGWTSVDEFYRPILGQLNIVTGVPSHGKSSWLDALLVNLWQIHHWRSVIFSPENYPPETHVVKLAQLMTGHAFDAQALARWTRKGFRGEEMSTDELHQTVRDLQDGFSFILPEIDGRGHNLDQLLEITEQEIYRTGAKIFVIDPFNEIDHHVPPHTQKTDYIGECLTRLRRFARYHQIAVYVVAHPTKMDLKPEKFKSEDGKEITLMVEPRPRAWDVADSAHWYNKADNVIVIWRDKLAEIRGQNPHLVTADFQKIKIAWTGHTGVAQLLWDPTNGRFMEPDEIAAANYDEELPMTPTLSEEAKSAQMLLKDLF